MKRKFILLVLAVCVVGSGIALAQSNNGANTRISLYYNLNSWKTNYKGSITALATATTNDKDKLTQGVFGLSASLMPNESFQFDFGTTMANSNYTSFDDNKSSLSSLNDTRFKGTYFVNGGVASAAIILNLPTGKRELTTEQNVVAAAIADDSRKLLVRRPGQGLDVGTELMYLPHSANVHFQIGGGYLYKGKYQALAADAAKYKFGDEISGVAGFSVDASQVTFVANDVVRYYREDKIEDQQVFQAGLTNSVNALILYNGQVSLHAGVNVLMRGKAKLQGSGDQQLTEESLKSGRNEMMLYAGGSFPIDPKLQALGRLEYQNLSANEYKSDQVLFRPKSNYVGFGAGIGYALTEVISTSLLGSYYTGKINGDSDLTGFGVSIVLSYRPM